MSASYKRKKKTSQKHNKPHCNVPSFCFQLKITYYFCVHTQLRVGGWVHSNDCPFIALPSTVHWSPNFAPQCTSAQWCTLHSAQWSQTIHHTLCCRTVHSEMSSTLCAVCRWFFRLMLLGHTSPILRSCWPQNIHKLKSFWLSQPGSQMLMLMEIDWATF